MVHRALLVLLGLGLVTVLASTDLSHNFSTPQSLKALLASRSFSFEAHSVQDKDAPKRWIYRGALHFDRSGLDVVAEVEELKFEHSLPPVKTFFHYAKGRAALIDEEADLVCLSPHHAPPLRELTESFAAAVPLEREDLSASVSRRCPSHSHLFRLEFAAKTFVLCFVSANELKARLIGEDFEADISLLADPKPRVNVEALKSKCPSKHYRDVVPHEHDHAVASDLWWVRSDFAPLKRTFTSALRLKRSAVALVPKRCVFLHGSGETNPRPPTSTFPDYWGKIESFTPQCSSRVFIHADTRENGWNSDLLQKSYCEAALIGNEPNSSTAITGAYIFTHSMGNLIMAAAINNSYCSIGPGTKWFSVSNPSRGSNVALYLEAVCKNNTNSLYKKIAQLIGACDSKGNPLPSYASLKPSNPLLPSILPIMSKYINGQLCGMSADGITTQYSLALLLISTISKLKDPDDGLVEASSCQLSASSDWRVYPDRDFYVPQVNHADATCRNGNGWFGGYRQPCSWYSARGVAN